MTRILVTGATGSLGGEVVRRLHHRGMDVTASGRNPAAATSFAVSGIRFILADLCNQASIVAAVNGHDVVIHCSGLSSAWGRQAAFDAANLSGTRHILDACERLNVRRLVHVSTPSIYFDFRDRLNIREDDPATLHPANAYVRSKLAAERLVNEAAARSLGTVIIRPKAIIGPRDRSLLPRLLRIARRGWLPLFDHGEALVDPTPVETAAEALILAATAPDGVNGRAYNIANGTPITVENLFQKIVNAFRLQVRMVTVPARAAMGMAAAMETMAGLMPGYPEPPLTRYTVGVLSRSQTFDLGAARRDLGYVPTISLEHAIAETARLWKAANA